MNISIQKRHIAGIVTIPSSKSQTIRAVLIATFAGGESIIRNPLVSHDTHSCIDVCSSLGAKIVSYEENNVSYLSVESNTLHESFSPIDCGNSGTTLYLAIGMAASCGFPITFTGDEQLQRRPIENLLRSLTDLGAHIDCKNSRGFGFPPCTIKGPLLGGETTIACPTSQYLSSLLLGAPLAKGDSYIQVPLLHERPYVYITRSYLDQQRIRYTTNDAMDYVHIRGNQSYHPFETTIKGDYSSASFFLCAAAITGGTLTICGLDPHDPQGDKEILTVLAHMGCDIRWTGEQELTITGPKKGSLRGGVFDLNAIPDALPILAVTSCYAHERVELINVPQARIKETDRIQVMCNNLLAVGAVIEEKEDGLVIDGKGTLAGGTCYGYDDHRVIMAMAIGALGAENPITIEGIEAVGVTFPTFFSLLDSITEVQ